MNSNDNTFYYFGDGTKTTSKVISLELEKSKSMKCNFYYGDHLYDLVDWKVEPPNTLDFYYGEQARKIRDEYDYVILCYSGGIDSTNILETFHKNSIKLDKILSVGAFSQDSFVGDDANRNAEIYHNVIPTIKKLELEKIFQMFDYTDNFYAMEKLPLFKTNSWIEHTGSWFSPHHWVWKNIYEYVVPADMKNKRVALIFGRDKPYLKYDEHECPFFEFNDTVLNAYGWHMERENIHAINFYWDPSFPEILIKQLHIINNYKQKTKKMIEHDMKRGSQLFDDISTHDLIYNLDNPLAYISKKSPSTIISLRDRYIINKKNSNLYENFKSGINELNRRLNKTMIPARTSKRYYIK
jgi:hypothetical protein